MQGQLIEIDTSQPVKSIILQVFIPRFSKPVQIEIQRIGRETLTFPSIRSYWRLCEKHGKYRTALIRSSKIAGNLIDVGSRVKTGTAPRNARRTFPTLARINLPETISPIVVVARPGYTLIRIN